jgi:hypothetical protein
MNYALQISGQLRKFKTYYQFYKRNLLHIPFDIFLSTWKNTKRTKTEDEGSIDEYIKLYHPINIEVEDNSVPIESAQQIYEKVLGNKKIINYVSPKITIFQAYKKHKCNLLRQSFGEKYDVVVLCRPDLILGEYFLEQYLHYAQDRLIIPMSGDWEGGICDLFAIGPPEYIDIYCNLFLHLEEYIEDNILFHPEHLLKWHLLKYNVPISRISYTIHLNQRRMT